VSVCVRLLLACLPPLGAVLNDPVRQRAFKTDIVTSLFRFNPFVAQNLLSFGLELTIQRRILEKISTTGTVLRAIRHTKATDVRM